MDAEKNALNLRLEKLEKQNQLMRQLSTRDGFYAKYFEEIPKAKTNEEAFNTLNDLYFELFGEYRYSDFDSFKTVTNRNYKKNKK
ncbi:MAG: hypothetical protein EOO51_12640 [Flavobacterium sp.]|nr:MAG: hypothetical protein EOO51_12640 [Flavobacterium sp.]